MEQKRVLIFHLIAISISKIKFTMVKTNNRYRNGKYLMDVNQIFSKPLKRHYLSMTASLTGLDDNLNLPGVKWSLVQIQSPRMKALIYFK